MRFTRTLPPMAALCLAILTSLTSIAPAQDYGYAYRAPSERRPLDGSLRKSPPSYSFSPALSPSYSYEPITWTGLYAGGHAGWTGGGSGIGGAFDHDIDTSGFSGGLHAGYNFQYQSIVTGLEADLDWTSAEGNETSAGDTFKAGADWLSSFRLRLGYAFNNFLIYGTGGIAVAGYDLDLASAGEQATLNQTMTGYAAGIGAEYAFTRSLIGRVEALHYGFGEEELRIGAASADADLNLTTVRAGFTLKLN